MLEAVSDLRLQTANTLLVTKLASNNRTSWYTSKVYRTLSILIYNAYNIDETTCYDMERSIRKWVLWILFYNITFKSIYLPKY